MVEERQGTIEPLEILVEDLFRIAGRGVVIAGRVRIGHTSQLRQGQRISIVRPDGAAMQTQIRGIEFSTPPPPPDLIAMLVGEEADEFVVVGSVIRQVASESH